MEGDKVVSTGTVGYLCFFEGSLVDIRRTGVENIYSVFFQYFSKFQCKLQIIILFLTILIDGTGIVTAVCRVLIAQIIYVSSPRLIRGFRNV